MKKETKTNAMRMLECAGIQFHVHTYQHDDGQIDGCSVAKKLGQNPEQVFKTLVTCSKNAYFVFVIPVQAELDLKKAAVAVGEKSVSMLPVAQLCAVTGYVRGGCSPVGMKKLFPTVFDSSALQWEEIMVSGGKVGFQISVPPQALLTITNGKTAAIAVD